jgi:hypothetical protein
VSFQDRRDSSGHESAPITTHYSAAEIGKLVGAANKVCDGGLSTAGHAKVPQLSDGPLDPSARGWIATRTNANGRKLTFNCSHILLFNGRTASRKKRPPLLLDPRAAQTLKIALEVLGILQIEETFAGQRT